MDFRNLLKTLNQINESVEVVAEKAESENQATAARIALKHKKEGTKPKAGTASAEMMKMNKSDLEDFTKAKKDAPKKKTNETFDAEAFRKSFEDMVEAKSKPDFLDVDKDGDKKEPMKKAAKDAKEKGGEEKSDKKGLSAKQKKLPPGLQKAISKKNEDINESFEKLINNEKLTFEEAVKIVRESGGQQKIDPVDTALWKWAQRVAANKFTESRKAEMYAGLVYERNGGVFQLHDVLSED